jgi:hypothetical protein
MSALYFLLGAVARMNAGMWRFRINFVPINIVVVGAIGAFGLTSFKAALDGVRNGSTPARVTLGQIRDQAEIVKNFVTVAGVEVPIAIYEYGTRGPGGQIMIVDKSWSPLVDRESERILLVERKGRLHGGDPREVTLTGMLRPLDSGVRESLAQDNDTIQGLPVETRYMLVAEARPGNSTTHAILSVILFGIACLFAIATAMRDTIFQPTGPIFSETTVAGAEPMQVCGTGTFALDQSGESIRQRFVSMPAVLAQLDSGHAALFANVDASSRFMGITTSRRAGVWSLPIEAGSVREAQIGFQYWGTSRRSAIRFAYTDTIDQIQRKAIIAVDNDAWLPAVTTLVAHGAG